MHIYIYIYMHLPTPLHGQDVNQGQFFWRSLKGLNSEFSFCYTGCLTKATEPSLPYYLPIARAVYIYIYMQPAHWHNG